MMRILRWLSPELRRARAFVEYACSLMPGATDRLLADLKRQAHTDLTQTAVAGAIRDGHPSTNPSPQERNESMPTLTPAERTAFANTMSAAEIWFFVIFVKSDYPEAFDATAERVRGMRAKDDQTMTADVPAFEES